MRTQVTERGQVSIPSEIRRALNIGAHTVVDWVLEGDSVRLVPLPADLVATFRGSGPTGGVARLLADRRADHDAG